MPAPAPLVVVSGPAGVGTTTASRLVAAELDRSVHLTSDEFMADRAHSGARPTRR